MGPARRPFRRDLKAFETLLLGPETQLRAPLGSLPPGRSVAAPSSPGASGSGSPSPRGSFSQSVDNWKQQSPCAGTGLALGRRPGQDGPHSLLPSLPPQGPCPHSDPLTPRSPIPAPHRRWDPGPQPRPDSSASCAAAGRLWALVAVGSGRRGTLSGGRWGCGGSSDVS